MLDVSNLLGSPASGEKRYACLTISLALGFQFIGFPSEWGDLPSRSQSAYLTPVSNLLGSPASGEASQISRKRSTMRFPIYWVPQRVGRLHLPAWREPAVDCFQFIGFPSEWGDRYDWDEVISQKGFQFIGFPSEWGEVSSVNTPFLTPSRFQFIGFPSEWGDFDDQEFLDFVDEKVSNLLGSPASGE
ncbi:hypothetical protein GlitD10_0645 [Gloeomargarita lithophora Alchichica-D10]|uniref:Uncharacterized protein n=1 Tax=Gloeomargarita lithophora Alchichica-D10 TaxID=1188229 RepID=A0A1J0AAK3_9CYAN|nr:hypothetical protein GlitD10_0645 [Gloeomargarita lithophora Alchichica-D10]